MKSERLRIIVGFILLCFIWGSTWLAIKIGLESVPPFYGLATRFIVGLAILFVLVKLRGLVIPLDRTSLKLFLAIGVLTFGPPFAIVYWAEQFLPSGLMSILFAIFPFVVVILSHFFLPNEPMNGYKFTGIALGFTGILIVFSRGMHWDEHSALLGMIAVLISAVFQASGLVVAKKYGKDISPIMINFGGMFVGTILVALVALTMEHASDIRFDAKAIGSILYLGSFGSVVTFTVYYWLLKRVEAVYLSLVAFVTPITAVFLGAIVLGESLESTTLLGAAFVLAGILVANGKGVMKLISNPRQKKSTVD